MIRMLEKVAAKVVLKSRQCLVEGVHQVETIARVLWSDDEDVESTKVLYLLSITLLFLLAFLSPDKMSQLFAPEQVGYGIVEKMQDVAKVLRRLIPT